MPFYLLFNRSRGTRQKLGVVGLCDGPGRGVLRFGYSRASAYCACSRCGWGLFGHFNSPLSSLSFLSPSLWETARYRLKYCLKGPLNQKQPTNQPGQKLMHWKIMFDRSCCIISAKCSVKFAKHCGSIFC